MYFKELIKLVTCKVPDASWLYLRERFLSLRLLHTTDAIMDACCDAWNRLVAEQDRVRSLCAYPWITKLAS